MTIIWTHLSGDCDCDHYKLTIIHTYVGVLHLDSIVKEYVAHRCTVLQRSTLKAVVNNLIELGLSLSSFQLESR